MVLRIVFKEFMVMFCPNGHGAWCSSNTPLSKFCMIEIHEMPHHIASKLLDFGMNNSCSILDIELFRIRT